MVQAPFSIHAKPPAYDGKENGFEPMNPQDCLIRSLRARVDFLQTALEQAKLQGWPSMQAGNATRVQEPLQQLASANAPLPATLSLMDELQLALQRSEQRCADLALALERKSLSFEELYARHAQLQSSVRKRLKLDALAHWWPSDAENSGEEQWYAEKLEGKDPDAPMPPRLKKAHKDILKTAFAARWPARLAAAADAAGHGASSLDLSPSRDVDPPLRRQRGKYDYFKRHCADTFEDTHRSFSSDNADPAQEPEEGYTEPARARGSNTNAPRSKLLNRKALAEKAYRAVMQPAELRMYEEEMGERRWQNGDSGEAGDEGMAQRAPRGVYLPLSPGCEQVKPRSPAKRTPLGSPLDDGEAQVFPPPNIAASQGYAAEWLETAEVWLGNGPANPDPEPPEEKVSSVIFGIKTQAPLQRTHHAVMKTLLPQGHGESDSSDDELKATSQLPALKAETDIADDGNYGENGTEVRLQSYRQQCEELTTEVNDLAATYASISPLSHSVTRRAIMAREEGEEDEEPDPCAEEV